MTCRSRRVHSLMEPIVHANAKPAEIAARLSTILE